MADKVLVVGNGIAGWAIAVGLAEAGFPTRLLDAGQVGTAATLKNEGWLHAGTYHAVSQATDAAALAVADRTQRGGRAILRDFPEVLERVSDRSVALISHDLEIEAVVDRWHLCGVEARSLTLAQTRDLLPELALGDTRAAFLVADQAVNSALLIDRLRNRFVRAGGKVLRGTAAGLPDEGVEIAKANGSLRHVTPALTVWAAGYAGIRMAAPLLAAQGLTPRLWRSHLLISDPVSTRSWFELQPGGLGHMHHLTHCVIGLNDDAVDITHAVEGDDPGDLKADLAFRSGLDRFGLLPVLDHNGRVVPCTKVDLAAAVGTNRDLILRSVFARPDLVVALPGKMTEAPVLAAEVTALAIRALRGAELPTRLGDRWSDAQVVLGNVPHVKAAAVISGSAVTKVHPDPRAAHFEVRVHADLAHTSLDVPPLRSTSVAGAGAAVTYQRIPTDVTGVDALDVEARTAALVEFQCRYAFGDSPLVLYRDAATPNMVESGGVLWQLDLSSCAQVRHQLDDLALLVETVPDDAEGVIALYRRWWSELRGGQRSPLVTGLAEVGIRFGDLLDSAYRNYEVALEDTNESGGWDRETARMTLPDVSLVELRWDDLAWFRSFRAARVRQKLGGLVRLATTDQEVMA